MKRILTVILISTLLLTVACLPENQEKFPLRSGGYGYVIADIVLIDTEKTPEIGDIVLYDDRINETDFTKMGPGIYLAKIIGLPGDELVFGEYSYEVNGYIGGKRQDGRTISETVIWGDERYDNIANTELIVPDNEFLTDMSPGREAIPGETDKSGSIWYHRFTIKQEAIIGVVLKKLGHDNKLEEELKGILY